MAKRYVVAWTGGFEEPTFKGFTDLDAAVDQMRDWAKASGSSLYDGDNRLDILQIDSESGMVEAVGALDITDEPQERKIQMLVINREPETLSV